MAKGRKTGRKLIERDITNYGSHANITQQTQRLLKIAEINYLESLLTYFHSRSFINIPFQ